MSHLSSSFLLAYKPSLHPISKQNKNIENIESLKSICSRTITLSIDLMDKINEDNVPRDLYLSLMSTALCLASETAIIKLIKKWPIDRLILKELVSPLFINVKHMYDKAELAESMRRSIKQTTSLAHNIIDVLKNKQDLCLKYLDLSGFPSAEVIVNYLSSHVMLAHNEKNQQDIINAYNNITENYDIKDKKTYSVVNSLSTKQLTVSIDAILTTEEAHMELCRALSVISKYENCPLKIIIRQLDASCLGVARIVVLLEIINVKFLQSISLQYNAITNEALGLLQPILSSLVNLSTLDLSNNSILLLENLPSFQQDAKLLGDALSSLPLLDSLDLSSNFLGAAIPIIFMALHKPFKVLRLKACSLQPVDITYILQNLPLNEIKELDLGANVFSQIKNYLSDLIKKCSSSLVILELEDIKLNETELYSLFNECSYINGLKFLNISFNPVLSKQILFDSLCYFFMTQQLQAVKMSYPLELVNLDAENVMISFEKKIFSAQIEFLLLSLCNMHHRAPLIISFI